MSESSAPERVGGTASRFQPSPARTDKRRRAILDVAGEAFRQDGYAATSMSSIAARLGGSKGTLYNYFRSKEELFAAFMQDVCGEDVGQVFDVLPPPAGALREGLIDFGCVFSRFILSEPRASIYRVVIGESGRFPELGRIFYEAGPKQGEERLIAYFASVMALGGLRRADSMVVARHFKELCLSGLHQMRLMGVAGDMSEAELRETVTAGVEAFLRAYGPE